MAITDMYGTTIPFPFFDQEECRRYLGDDLTDILEVESPGCIDKGYLAVGSVDQLTGKRSVYGKDSDGKLAHVGQYHKIMKEADMSL